MNFGFVFMVTTKYWKTQSRILEYIVKHRIPRGGVLPTEKKMSELFGVSLITIRKAVSNLEQEKILRREQGRGTFLQKDLTESPPKNGELLYLEMLPRVKTIYAPNAFPWTDEYLEKLRHMGWKISVLFTDPKPEANARVTSTCFLEGKSTADPLRTLCKACQCAFYMEKARFSSKNDKNVGGSLSQMF